MSAAGVKWLTDRRELVLGLALVVLALGMSSASTSSASTTDSSSSTSRSFSSDSSGVVDRIVVRGSGCLGAEDSTRLRLVEWSPARSLVVFRCVKP